MPDTLHCPFCGTELRTSMLDEPVAWYCPNRCIGTYEPKVWRALITGKKAQRQLQTAKDRFAKKIKAQEREIANYLNGINVRNKEIETLHKRLQKVQDTLKEIYDFIEDGALTMEKAGMPDNKNVYKEMLDKILSGITKQDE